MRLEISTAGSIVGSVLAANRVSVVAANNLSINIGSKNKNIVLDNKVTFAGLIIGRDGAVEIILIFPQRGISTRAHHVASYHPNLYYK